MLLGFLGSTLSPSLENETNLVLNKMFLKQSYSLFDDSESREILSFLSSSSVRPTNSLRLPGDLLLLGLLAAAWPGLLLRPAPGLRGDRGL